MARKERQPTGPDPLVTVILDLKTELEKSSWFSDFRKSLKIFIKKCTEIRCLALGEVAREKNPQYQLALLLYLIEKLKPQKVTAWDPYFSKKDIQLLQQLGINVTEQDPKLDDETQLLWYVPHGPYFLEPQLLQKVGQSVYIGNDLTKYRPGSTRNLDTALEYKSKAKIVPLREKKQDPWMMAFVNTAIHKLNDTKEAE